MSLNNLGKKQIVGRDKAIDKYAPGLVNGDKLSRYPGIFQNNDKKDENWQIKQMAAKAGWQVPLSDSDVEWIKSKKNAREAISYDEFMQKIWPSIENDPVNAKFAAETWPELFEARREWAKNQQDIQFKLFDINLKGGPTTKEEYELIYHIQQGSVEVHPLSVHVPVRKTDYAKLKPVRGAFNPNRGGKVAAIDKDTGIISFTNTAPSDKNLARPNRYPDALVIGEMLE